MDAHVSDDEPVLLASGLVKSFAGVRVVDGVDPQARFGVWELIDTLRREGLAIVLTTHYMDEAERLSDNLLVLRGGCVVAEGLPRKVLGDLVGEHMLVLDAGDPAVPVVCAWAREAGLPEPARVLSALHLALDGPGLAQFSARFGELRFEVRSPLRIPAKVATRSEEKWPLVLIQSGQSVRRKAAGDSGQSGQSEVA
ncbi:MAG: hypothetical protein AADX95_19665, partial [Thiocapsa sp. N5-Cardenillas]